MQEEGKAIKKAARIKIRREGQARVRTREVKGDGLCLGMAVFNLRKTDAVWGS